MTASIRIAAAALLALLSASGTQDRTLESFDVDAIPYADRVMVPNEFFSSLPSMQRAWRDVRDPMKWAGGSGEALCATTEGSTVRCWTLRRTFRETLRETPWIRRDLLWHSVGTPFLPWCVHNRADHSVECVNKPSARQDGVAQYWLTADSVFLYEMSVCARSGARVSCRTHLDTIEFTLPSATARIEKLGRRTLCSRVGDRLDCHHIDPGIVHEALDLSHGVVPTGRRGTTPRTSCEFVFDPELRFVHVSPHFSMPWRSEAERRSLFLVMPDPNHPDRLDWRRRDEVFPASSRVTQDEIPECDRGNFLAWEFWNISIRIGFTPDRELATSILGEDRTRRELTPRVIFDADKPADWLFIHQASKPPLRERLMQLVGMSE